jgi:glyoxylase-like metal-dependent hydrolase (beta-lactamase superfamily II)
VDMMIAQEGWTVYPIIFPTERNLKSFNFFLLEQSGSLILIDAGVATESCWNFFYRTLKENGFSVHDLTSIILTHNHIDHVGLVNRILEYNPVPVYAHQAAIPRLKRDKEFFSMRIQFFKQLYEEMGCGNAGKEQVNRLINVARENEIKKIKGEIMSLENGQTVEGLTAIETPGHSPDHLIFYDPKRKWMFGGDLLIRHISSNAIVEPDQDGNRMLTLLQYINSLKKCLELDAETVFPGHGELITNHKELITNRLNRIDEKADKLLALITHGIQTADQLARTYYKDRYRQQFSLVMSEIIGHLDYLEWSHRVVKEKKNGVWIYSPVTTH